MRHRTVATMGLMLVLGAGVATGALAGPLGGRVVKEPKEPQQPQQPPQQQPPCVVKTFQNDEIYTATSLTTPPLSTYFCGKHYRLRGRDLSPDPDKYPDGTFVDPHQCHSNDTYEDGSFVPAHERAEVRGWIRAVVGGWDYGDFEQEFRFDIEPDIGWEPTAQGVWPVNTFERVAQLMTPLNDLNSHGFHVEFSLWSPVRMCGYHHEPDREVFYQEYHNNGRGHYCSGYERGSNPKRPPELCMRNDAFLSPLPFDFDRPPHSKEFDEPCKRDGCRFGVGNYVRIVGTLWEDDSHVLAGYTPDDPCRMESRTRTRGWMEIHPVDFMARIPSPPTRESSGIKYVNLCVPSSSTQTVTGTVQVTSPDPRPPGSYRLRVREIVNPAFTNFGSISGNPTEASRIRVAGAVATVTVQVSSVMWQGRGLFFAAYQGTWEPCQPQCLSRCGGAPDGCDGRCATTCAASQTCSLYHCCPQGQRWCADEEQCQVSCPHPPYRPRGKGEGRDPL